MTDLVRLLQEQEKQMLRSSSNRNGQSYISQCREAYTKFDTLIDEGYWKEAFDLLTNIPGLVEFLNPFYAGMFYDELARGLGEKEAKQYRKLVTYKFQESLSQLWDEPFNEVWQDFLKRKL